MSGGNPIRPNSSNTVVPIYRVVVFTLSLAALGSLVASFCLAWALGENEIPQSIVALGSTAVGALVGVLITEKR